MSRNLRTYALIIVCILAVSVLVIDAAYSPHMVAPEGDTITNAHIADSSDLKIEKVQRSIQITKFGLVIIKENYTIYNKASYPVNGCELAYINAYYKKTSYISAYEFTKCDELLTGTPHTKGDMTYIPIFFNTHLQPNEKHQFRVVSCFSDSVTLERAQSYYTHVLKLETSLYPIVPYPIEHVSVRITFFDELEIPHAFSEYAPHADFIKNKTLHYERSDLDPHHNEVFKATYYSDFPPCIFTYAKRTIEIDPWGFIYITEKQTIKNVGLESSSINKLDFFVPSDATDIKAHDDLGNLTLSVYNPDDEQKEAIDLLNGTIDMRIYITGNYSYTFTLSYRLDLENHTKTENSQYVLDTWLYTLMNAQIESLDVILILPEGARLKEGVSYNSTDTYLDFTRRVYQLKTGERAAAVNNELVIYVDIPLVAMIIRPLFFTLIIFVIGSVFVLTRTLKEIILPEKLPLNIEARQVIKNFCNLYDSLFASRVMIGRLNKQKRRKEITIKEYAQERNKIFSEIGKLENALENVKEKMYGLGENFQNIIKTLEQLEIRRVQVRKMIKTAFVNLNRKKIQQKTFNRIVNDQRKVMRSTDEKIDHILLELREDYL